MLTDKEKIETLSHLIKSTFEPNAGEYSKRVYQQAQQWLAELESGGDWWVSVDDALPETYSRVL